MPTDKPINLDISKFLQADTLSPKLDDIDIISEALKQHPVVESIL